MIFPILDLMDEQKCFDWLLIFFHDSKLPCPKCGAHHYHAHKNTRKPVTQNKCDDCGRFALVSFALKYNG